MTKDQVKTLGEGDPRLQWWAMVLFAEICEVVEFGENNRGYEAKHLWFHAVAKAKEFERLVVQRKLEDVEAEGDRLAALEARVAKLEAVFFGAS